MVVLYLVSLIFLKEHFVFPWLKAIAEAGMIGGLADWFAITALFKHPLGIPIPHTAILPRKKNKIAKSLAQFIHINFLSSEHIQDKLKNSHFSSTAIAWLKLPKNSQLVANQIAHLLPKLLSSHQASNLDKIVSSQITTQLKVLEPSQTLQNLIQWILKNDKYKPLFSPALKQLSMALSANHQLIDHTARENAPLAHIPILNKISKSFMGGMSDKAVQGIERALKEASEDENSEHWQTIFTLLERFQSELAENPDLKQQLIILRDSWFSGEKTQYLTQKICSQLEVQLNNDLKKENSSTIHLIQESLQAISTKLINDERFIQELDTQLINSIVKLSTNYGEQVEAMIRETIEGWDNVQFTEKIESQVGNDLQYIRINGTLLGALIGLIIHSFELLF